MIFFKYYSINKYTIDAIKNKYFYCSRPSQLNDLFDCRVPIEYRNKSDKELEEWIECNGGGWLTDILPYDFPYNTVEKLKEAFLDGSFEEYFYQRFNKKEVDSFHIFSLADTYRNQVLWGSYTNNEGICVEFDASRLECSKRINPYIDSKSEYGFHVLDLPETRDYFYSEIRNDKYVNIYKVDYNFEPFAKYDFISDRYMISSPQSDIVDLDPTISQNLITKNKDWSYENEYRCIYRTYGKDDATYDNKLHYSDEVIKSITFGYKATNESIKKVIEAVKEAQFKHEIQFYQIHPDFTTKSIERYPISLNELLQKVK